MFKKLRISRWRQRSTKASTGPCVLAQLLGCDPGPDRSVCYSNTEVAMDDFVVTVSPVFGDALEHNHMKPIRPRLCSIVFYLPLPIAEGWKRTSQTTTGSPESSGLTDMAWRSACYQRKKMQKSNLENGVWITEELVIQEIMFFSPILC